MKAIAASCSPPYLQLKDHSHHSGTIFDINYLNSLKVNSLKVNDLNSGN